MFRFLYAGCPMLFGIPSDRRSLFYGILCSGPCDVRAVFPYGAGRGSERKMVAVIVMAVISLLIPILCVSRFQFVFAVLLAVFTYISLQKSFNPLFLLGLFVVLVPVYLILTVARSHDVEYLNGILR